MESEFGKGFAYCIGLFLAHTEREDPEGIRFGLWFNGAADHLYELETPKNFTLYKECEEWRGKCLHWRLHKYTKKNKFWAIEQAKRFLLAWDKQNNIPCVKGDWD